MAQCTNDQSWVWYHSAIQAPKCPTNIVLCLSLPSFTHNNIPSCKFSWKQKAIAGAMVVVKWSVCILPTSMIHVRIPLMSTILICKKGETKLRRGREWAIFKEHLASAFMFESVWPDWAIYWALGNFSKATILPKSPTFLGNYCKRVKIFNFSSEIIFGQLLDIWWLITGHTGLS